MPDGAGHQKAPESLPPIVDRSLGSELGGPLLRFLVDMVWDESVDLQTRLSAAAIVVPYLHPRLSATQVHKDIGDPNTAVLILSTDPIEAAQTYQRLISGD